MKWLLSLIGVSPYALLGFVAAATGLFFFGRYEGGHAQRLNDAAALADAEALVIAGIKQANVITYNVSAQADAKIAEIKTITKTLILKVPEYVSPQADAACVVPRGFVRLHDAAASGVPPVSDPTGQPNDAPSGVAISRVGSTVADNYGTCRVQAAQLEAVQSWIEQQRTLFGKNGQ